MAETNFSGALATWKSTLAFQFHSIPENIPNKSPTAINLSDLQITLDAQGFEVVQNQKESLVGRKALADRTKGPSPPPSP
jgi:homeobox protein cut-like